MFPLVLMCVVIFYFKESNEFPFIIHFLFLALFSFQLSHKFLPQLQKYQRFEISADQYSHLQLCGQCNVSALVMLTFAITLAV